MKLAEMKGSPATCGCANTGSATVTIEGHGAVRARSDKAKGLILGGVPSVTVEGYPISVVGDPVTPHGKGLCASAKTAKPSSTVLVGEGDGPQREGQAVRFQAPTVTAPESRCRGQVIYPQEKPYTCLLASMRMVIRQQTGHAPTEPELVADAKKLEMYDAATGKRSPFYDEQNGTYAEGAPDFLARHGVPAFSIGKTELTADTINAATNKGAQPMLVGVNNSAGAAHAVVVDGIDPAGNVLYRDPGISNGCQSVPLADFVKKLYDPDQRITILGSTPPGWPAPQYTLQEKKP
jgi:uncharacterized Zn-binding protein involved in type VI secretion